MPAPPSAIPLIRLSEEYLNSASLLLETKAADALQQRATSPACMLLAHGLELALKAHLVRGDSALNVEAFGHDLERLYLALKAVAPGLIQDVEHTVQQAWRVHFRAARDDHQGTLTNYGIDDPAMLGVFGVADNTAIGKQLPDLWHDVLWLSDRHKSGGGQFRYPVLGHDRIRHVRCFGLDEPTVLRSIPIATRRLIDLFE